MALVIERQRLLHDISRADDPHKVVQNVDNALLSEPLVARTLVGIDGLLLRMIRHLAVASTTDIVRRAITQNAAAIDDIPDEFWKDYDDEKRTLIESVIKESPWAFDYLPEEQQNDERLRVLQLPSTIDSVDALYTDDGELDIDDVGILAELSEDLTDDLRLFMDSAAHDGRAIVYASRTLQANPTLIDVALTETPFAMYGINLPLVFENGDDKEVLSSAVKTVLKRVSEDIEYYSQLIRLLDEEDARKKLAWDVKDYDNSSVDLLIDRVLTTVLRGLFTTKEEVPETLRDYKAFKLAYVITPSVLGKQGGEVVWPSALTARTTTTAAEAAVPAAASRIGDVMCTQCGQNKSIIRCKACMRATYCGESCREKHWVKKHAYECGTHN